MDSPSNSVLSQHFLYLNLRKVFVH